MIQIPAQYQQYFPNGLDGPVDWENIRKLPGPIRDWLWSQGIDVDQKAASAAARREVQPGLEGDLAGAQKEYDTAPDIARTSTIEDTKRAGNYGETPQARASQEYEAGMRAKGIQTASESRIKELKKQLGYPV